MKITGIETSWFDRAASPWLLVRILTDEAVVGFGEASVTRFGHAVEACLLELKEQLIGRDPLQIRRHWEECYMGHGGPRGGSVHMAALSALDIALWDIAGKALETPVYGLLGGACRDRIRLIASGWATGSEPKAIGDQAADLVQRGFTALQVGPWTQRGGPANRQLIEQTARLLEAIRTAVGESVDLIIDCDEQLSASVAEEVHDSWGRLHPFWLLDPLPRENVVALTEFAGRVALPVAVSQVLCGRHSFRPVLESGSIHVLQPDLGCVGGLTEGKRLADVADAFSVSVALRPAGGPILLAASIQLAFSLPNLIAVEIPIHEARDRERLLGYGFPPMDGYLPLPSTPGLGITLDAERARHLSDELPGWSTEPAGTERQRLALGHERRERIAPLIDETGTEVGRRSVQSDPPLKPEFYLVDTHAHVGLAKYRPVEDLLAVMNRHGIDKAILVQYGGNPDNTYLSECLRRFPGRFAAVGIVDDTSDDAPARLTRWVRDRGIAGVRLSALARSPGGDPFAIWAAIQELDIVASVTGTLDEMSSPETEDLVRKFPRLKFRFEHMGWYPDVTEAPPYPRYKRFLRLADYHNAYTMYSAFYGFSHDRYPYKDTWPFIELVHKAFGAERLMWGADWPLIEQHEGYAQALNFVRDLPMSERDRAWVLGRTATTLWRL